MTFEKLQQAKALLDTDYNETEFFSSMVMEQGRYFFELTHLNGETRLLEVCEVIK